MFIPNGFMPSTTVRHREYDEEGRLREFRVNSPTASSGDPGISESNSLYATESEEFGSCAPFLKANKIKDAQRRNYVIQPGGRAVFRESSFDMDEDDGGSIRRYVPSERTSFGHDTAVGTKFGGGSAPRGGAR